MVNPTTSLLISSSLAGVIFMGVVLYQKTLQSSDFLKFSTGFVCSLFYLFIFTAISNFKSSLKRGQSSSGWVEIFISILLAVYVAFLVHPVSCTSCILFSTIWTFELSKVSSKLYDQQQHSTESIDATPTKKKK